MTIKELCTESARIRALKGFVTEESNMLEKLMLVVTELSEAAEFVRDANFYDNKYIVEYKTHPEHVKPEGFVYELADAVIRIGDICGSLSLDLESAVLVKSLYNENRAHMHGRKA